MLLSGFHTWSISLKMKSIQWLLLPLFRHVRNSTTRIVFFFFKKKKLSESPHNFPFQFLLMIPVLILVWSTQKTRHQGIGWYADFYFSCIVHVEKMDHWAYDEYFQKHQSNFKMLSFQLFGFWFWKADGYRRPVAQWELALVVGCLYFQILGWF